LSRIEEGKSSAMARKTPSAHSDEQFALFLERARGRLEAEQRDRFEDVVRNLILHSAKATGKKTDDDTAEAPSGSDLLSRPDFGAIDGAAGEATANGASLLTLTGQLAFCWSNNESLLIYTLKLLLGTDEPSAAIVFSTLNTTRARIYLVRRLATIKVAEREARAELERLIENLDQANRLRNEFMQATYAVNERGETHTQVVELESKNGRLRFFNERELDERQPIDPARIAALVQACRDLRHLNREMLDFLPRLKKAVRHCSKARSDDRRDAR
jgi:hypothetical protein